MADKLNGQTPGIGHNTPEVTQEQFLRFLERYDEADQTIADAVGDRKNLRTEIKTAGGKNFLKAFDRARKDADRSGEARTLEDQHYRRMMAWMHKPVGFQAELLEPETPAAVVAFDVHQLKKVDNEGFDAGKTGRRRDSCPWSPGTEAAQRWNSAWLRGQETIAETLAPDGPKPKGRPRGSKNKSKNGAEATA